MYPKETILRKFADDFGMVQIVAEVFLADYPDQLEKINAAVLSKNCHDLAEACHKLKGAAANFSDTIVVDVAVQIEVLANENRLDDAIGLIAQLLREVEELKNYLTKILD